MLYTYTKRYLKKNYKLSTSITWGVLDNVQFFNYIYERYTQEEFEKEISEVKEAFKDFFEPVGNILFRYKDGTIKIKIFPYVLKPQDSIYLDELISIIKNNPKAIKYPYKGQMNQIAITGKIRRAINQVLYQSNESINKKELIKYAIRKALELNERDIIVQLKKIFVVKIYHKTNAVAKNTEEIDSIDLHEYDDKKNESSANRYNGYDEEELKATYKELFPTEEELENFLNTTMDTLFQTKLNFKTITNKYYEENSLKLIHSQMAKELENYSSYEKDFLYGLAGYIFRQNFQKVHELMAMEIIKCIYEQDKNAKEFMLYYNGDTIIKDNKKYIIPSLETEDGRKWNNSSLIGICNLWMNIKKKKTTIENKIKEINNKINKLNQGLSVVEPEIKKLEKELEEKNEIYTKKQKEYKEMEIKFKLLQNSKKNSNEYFTMLKKLDKANTELMAYKSAVKDIQNKIDIIKESNMSSYIELAHYKDLKKNLLLDLRAQTLNINSKSQQMDPILNSLAKALMSRKKLIS